MNNLLLRVTLGGCQESTAYFDPHPLYKYVSGLNPVRLRQLLQGFLADTYIDGDP